MTVEKRFSVVARYHDFDHYVILHVTRSKSSKKFKVANTRAVGTYCVSATRIEKIHVRARA
jgi:hypothetical protein